MREAPQISRCDARAVQATPVPHTGSRVRHRVLLLTFLASFLMYMDRACLGVVTSAIMRDFHIGKISIGWSVSAFLWGYALFQVAGGWMVDRFGPRLILGCALAWWSLFTAATGLSTGAVSLAGARFLLGVGEAAAFPASSRSLYRWLPVSDRAFGQGFQHAGSRLGAAVAPPVVVVLIVWIGWRSVFYILGTFGALWAVGWYWYYRNDPAEHASVDEKELHLIRSGTPILQAGAHLRVPWRYILRSRDLWYLSAMYLCYGWVLWMYLLWLPSYLVEVRHFVQLKMGLVASLPLLAATVTNVAGGWTSDRLARRWRDLRRGRTRVSIFGFTLAGLTLIPGVLARNALIGMTSLTLALAAMELTVAVSWAICLDIGGDFSGSVSSVMNTFGNIGGALASVMIGYLVTLLGWNWPFLVASTLCLIAALLACQIDPARPAFPAAESR